jgi:4'-phosphopantetheinyl transferase
MPQFSVSHSEDIAVVALSHSPLGIDIEHVHEIPELLAIAKRYFLDSECDQLVRLPQARRVRAFFEIWTAREECLKATGEGLAGWPRSGTRVADSSDTVLTEKKESDWKVSRLARDGYIVALATSEQVSSPALHEFDPDCFDI